MDYALLRAAIGLCRCVIARSSLFIVLLSVSGFLAVADNVSDRPLPDPDCAADCRSIGEDSVRCDEICRSFPSDGDDRGPTMHWQCVKPCLEGGHKLTDCRRQCATR